MGLSIGRSQKPLRSLRSCTYGESRGTGSCDQDKLRLSSPLLCHLVVYLVFPVSLVALVHLVGSPVRPTRHTRPESRQSRSSRSSRHVPLTPNVSPFTSHVSRPMSPERRDAFTFRAWTPQSRGQVTECASLRRLSWRPFHGGPSGNLLEFPQPRSCDRGALVSSSVPSQDAGWGRTGMPSCFAPRPP